MSSHRATARLADLTTIGLGGPAPRIDTATTADEVAALFAAADDAGGALVLGGGSNLVVADRGLDLPLVRIAIRELTVQSSGDGDPERGRGESLVTIGAGEDWDRVVAELVAAGFSGVAELSGIPGLAGATPVQNVGAYGVEIADLLDSVDVYDRYRRRIRSLDPAQLRLGYRTSTLRRSRRGVVTAVRLRLTRRPRPVRYPALAQHLGIEPGVAAPPEAVREAVLDLRRSKGMVLDPADTDTRSVGSFFTNPIVDDQYRSHIEHRVLRRLGTRARMPQYPAGAGLTKLSAAWLIEQAGFPRGYPLAVRPGAGIAVSSKHSLALTNRGHGTTAELVALAREIRDGVYDAFSVTLTPEPILLGVDLDHDRVPGQPAWLPTRP